MIHPTKYQLAVIRVLPNHDAVLANEILDALQAADALVRTAPCTRCAVRFSEVGRSLCRSCVWDQHPEAAEPSLARLDEELADWRERQEYVL